MSESTGWPEALRQEGEALEREIVEWARSGRRPVRHWEARRAAFVEKVKRVMLAVRDADARSMALKRNALPDRDALALLSEKDVNV